MSATHRATDSPCPVKVNYLLDQLNTSGQIHAEIDKHPINALSFVFFLFQYEHVMVEKLLQFLVGEVDTELFKPVELRTHTFIYRYKTHGKMGDQHDGALAHKRSLGFGLAQFTFSINSIQAARSMPKSINTQSIPSCLYSSCSSTNMWWLKNCCSFSLVKLMQSCSKPLYYYQKNAIPQFESNLHYTVCMWLVLKAC